MVVGIVFVLVALAIGLLLALVGVTYLRAYVRIGRTDVTPVGELTGALDEVAVSGTVHPLTDPTPARFADADTVISDWELAERRGSGDNRRWSTLYADRQYDAFLVDDGTGRVVVDPEGAEWMLEAHGESFGGSDPPAVVRRFLAERGESADDLHGRRRHRYSENRLDVGENVYVYGPVRADAPVNADGATAGVAIGTDRTTDEGMTAETTMRLTPGVVPFVGDPDETLSLGGAEESTLFTVADSPARASGRRYLKRGVVVLLFALTFGGFGVAMGLKQAGVF